MMKTRLLKALFVSLILQASVAPSFAEPALTEEERDLLDRGEISTGEYVAGGVVGTFLGLGIGNAIQGTYMPTGLIFTLGEIGAVGLIAAGASNCLDTLSVSNNSASCRGGTFTAGYLILVGLRVWEIIDVWATPPRLNRKIQSIRARSGLTSPHAGIAPVMSPTGSLAGAQLSLKFEF